VRVFCIGSCILVDGSLQVGMLIAPDRMRLGGGRRNGETRSRSGCRLRLIVPVTVGVLTG
jgi:hypothetical protein